MENELKIFINRKEKGEKKARIPGYKTLIDQSSQFKLIQVSSKFTDNLFDGPFYYSESPDPKFPSVNLVFVQDKFGNTEAENPADLGGGETDHHLIYEGLSRVYVDGVLAGANTIRGSGIFLSVWHPEMVKFREAIGLPRHPAQILATASGKIGLDSELIFNIPELKVYILTTNEGRANLESGLPKRPWVEAISTGEESDLRKGLKILRTKGVRTISAIGGRTLATDLIDQGLIQDLYLTTSQVALGESNTPFYVGEKRYNKNLVLRKEGKGEEKGIIFEHLRLG